MPPPRTNAATSQIAPLHFSPFSLHGSHLVPSCPILSHLAAHHGPTHRRHRYEYEFLPTKYVRSALLSGPPRSSDNTSPRCHANAGTRVILVPTVPPPLPCLAIVHGVRSGSSSPPLSAAASDTDASKLQKLELGATMGDRQTGIWGP